LHSALVRLGYHSTPSFLIIGAQKAGTTALYYYLAEHPNIVTGLQKEIGFFAPELFEDWPEHPNHALFSRRKGKDFFDPTTYPSAAAWYHRHFPLPHERGKRNVTYEATPEYLYYPAVPQRIYRYDSSMKLIAILRNPVERAYSAWKMYCNFGVVDYHRSMFAPRREMREFDEAIREELESLQAGTTPLEPGYVARGLYRQQLERYLELFERDQLLVLEASELRRESASVVKRSIAFLGLPEHRFSGDRPLIHVGQNKSEIPRASARRLQHFYRPHNESLYELLGYDLGWE
jgi:hypothetical protein